MIKSLLEKIQANLIFETVTGESPALRNHGDSFTLAHMAREFAPDAKPAILRRGDYYCHAAIIVGDWLVNVASLTWAYNLRTGLVINTIGNIQVDSDEFSPLMPVHFRWHIGSHIIDDVTLDNASFSSALFDRALNYRINQPHKLRCLCYKDGFLHALDGLDYTIYRGDEIHNVPNKDGNFTEIFDLFHIPEPEREQVLRRLHYMRTKYGL